MRRKLWIVTFCREIPALRNLCFWAQGRGVVAHPALYVQPNEDAADSDPREINVTKFMLADLEDEDEPIFERRDVYKLLVDRPVPAGTTLISIPLDRDGDEFRKKEFHGGKSSFSPDSEEIGRMPSYFGDDPEVVARRTCVMRTRMAYNSRSTAHLMLDSDGSSIRGDSTMNPMSSPALSQLVEKAARGLHSTGYPFRPYLEFLHDLHNSNETVDVVAPDGDIGDSFKPVDPFKLAQKEIDEMTLGNELNIRGVENAPFLVPSDVQSSRARASVAWAHQSLKQMSLGLPHFCAGSALWAQSMVLSRGFTVDSVPPTSAHLPDPLLLPCVPGISAHEVDKQRASADEVSISAHPIVDRSTQEIALVPLMDFCRHSPDPSCHYCISVPSNKGRNYGQTHDSDPQHVGVKGWRCKRPSVHLVALRNLKRGDEVTLKYMDEGNDSQVHENGKKDGGKVMEGREIWKVRYGYIPRGASSTRLSKKVSPSFSELSRRVRSALTLRFQHKASQSPH